MSLFKKKGRVRVKQGRPKAARILCSPSDNEIYMAWLYADSSGLMDTESIILVRQVARNCLVIKDH